MNAGTATNRLPVFDNRITRMLGVRIPIANAPMGTVASPEMVAAVIGAGAIGLVPGSIGSARTLPFLRALREATDRSFGVNIPVSFAEATFVDMLIEQGVRFVTTSSGPVAPYTARLQAAGLKVLHVVTSLETAQSAADAGVDGLIVEGSEGGGLRGTSEVPLMVLLPSITSRIDLPVIAAGGIVDGRSMAAAFALGAEGVQMGTRMLASVEAGVHRNLKQAVVQASAAESIMINRHNQRPLRVLRTTTTQRYESPSDLDAFKDLIRDVPRLYEEGNMEVGFASVGQASDRIDNVLPVEQIIQHTIYEFGEAISGMARLYLKDICKDYIKIE